MKLSLRFKIYLVGMGLLMAYLCIMIDRTATPESGRLCTYTYTCTEK